MTTITHHIDDATLMAYAAGTLPEAVNLIVAAHVSLCDESRAALESCDAIGGSLLDQTEGVPMDIGSLEATMKRLMDVPLDDKPTPPKKGILPAPIQDYVGGDLDAIRWRPVGMGVKQAILPTSDKATARLLFIPAGAAMPEHSHHGRELTLVLQGAFHDDGETFARGDIEIADEDVHHIPVADISEDCICLAVTDAPLRFKGIIPRIVQKFVRI